MIIAFINAPVSPWRTALSLNYPDPDLTGGTSTEYLVGTTGVLFLFHMSYIGTWPVGSLLRMKRIYHSSIDSLHRMILLDWCIADWYLRVRY